MTPEQQKALALARARRRRAESSSSSWGNTAVDVLKSAGAGLARGTAGLAGLPGTLGDLVDQGGEFLMRQAGLPTRSEAMTAQGLDAGNPLSAQSLQDAMSILSGGATDYQGQTTAGKYAGTVAEFIPGAAAFGGANPSNLAMYGAIPGVASEAAGQATEGTGFEPYARIAAALAAPMAVSGAGRVISPYGGRIDPQRMRAAEVLRAEGVNPTAGQLTGSRALLARESELGGARAADMMDDQARAFTEAAMRRTGQQGTATPENMANLYQRLGQGFKDISSRNTLVADQGLVSSMNKTFQEYYKVLPSDQKRIVRELGQDIADRFRAGGGSIPGSDYQTIRSRLGRVANSAKNSDPEYANALRGMRNALDDAMSRSVSPGDAPEWTRLRREYGNMKVIENAATGAGAEAAMGNISPQALRGAAVAGRRGQYARGEGDFDELARAGNAVLQKLPDSGTPARLNARTIGGFGSILGAGAGGYAGGPLAGMAGAALGAAAPYAAGRALMSKPVQSWLTNQMVNSPDVLDPRIMAVVQSLIGNSR